MSVNSGILSANDAWRLLLVHIGIEGDPQTSRNLKYKEVICYTSKVNMSWPIVTFKERKLGYRFMGMEAYNILTGDNRVASIKQFSPIIESFSDDGIYFKGHYGPKVTEQLPYIIDALRKDIGTRQAVMTIWRERPGPSKDIPCTVALQWLVRYDEVNCIATMRSSDSWLGWPYDVFTFSIISGYIARILGLRLGNLYLTSGSQHIYNTDSHGVFSCLENKEAWAYEPFVPADYAHPQNIIDMLKYDIPQAWGFK